MSGKLVESSLREATNGLVSDRPAVLQEMGLDEAEAIRRMQDRDELTVDLLEMMTGLFRALQKEPKEGGDAGLL